MSRRKSVVLSFYVAVSLLVVATTRRADASPGTVTFADGCCCEDVVDCTLSGSANPACNAGHSVVSGSLRGCGSFSDYIPGFGKCFGVGCIGGGGGCQADIGPMSWLPNPPTPTEVALNGVDDDCDGLIDECIAGASLACSTHVRSCAAAVAGSELCMPNGFPSNVCVAATETANPDFCPKAACKGGVINNADSDGDGLFDCWEDEGIDYDGDGTIDFTLPGANKNHKDVYVEADYFACAVAGGDCAAGDLHTHQPMAAAINIVVASFVAAPVNNPDGVQGIALHLLVDEALPHQAVCPFKNTCYEVIKAANFGTAAERANSKALLAKRLVYRYSLWEHDLNAGDGTSGISRAPSADLVVSLGEWTLQVGTTLDQAGTFMHELGHDLGLDHGGGDAINFKPNYLSVMNYRFQTTGRTPGNIIDYSRAALANLTETNLSEPLGIGDGAFNTFWRCPGALSSSGLGNGPLNWDCLPLPNTATNVGVTADINGDRICVTAGADGILQTVVAPGDVVAGGTIKPGLNGVLDSTLAAGSDDLFQNVPLVGNTIVPGPDGVLQSTPLMDDLLSNLAIWDGANRTCESPTMGDDVVDGSGGTSRVVGNAQPASLNGFDDWQSLRYDFADLLRGFQISAGTVVSAPELTQSQASVMKTESKVADLSMAQTVTRTPDGTVVVHLDMRNLGPDAADMPTVSDRLPTTISFKSCTTTTGGQCSVIGGSQLAFSFASLGSGQTGSATVTACSTSSSGISNTATATATSTDPNLANNTATGLVPAPIALPATQLANGDMRYAITFSAAQAYVEAFVRQNGVQSVSGNIVANRVTNPDGTFTYSRIVPAVNYHAGDVLNVRFYSYRSGQPAVYTPGPLEFVSYPDFVYGSGSTTCSTACRPKFQQLADGSVKVTTTFTAAQSYVEAFVRVGSTQVAAGNIVQSGVVNFDGTFTYTRIVPASSFHAGDHVSFRFYSYISSQPQTFRPGPSQNDWFPGFTYSRAPTSDCGP